jgi:hypothetical protein
VHRVTDREMIEAALDSDGFTAERWQDGEDGLEAVVAGSFTVLEDYDDEGLFEGDSGTLTAGVAGGEEFGNRRVWFGFTAAGMNSGAEVRDLSALEHS